MQLVCNHIQCHLDYKWRVERYIRIYGIYFKKHYLIMMNIVDHNWNMAFRFAEYLFYTMPLLVCNLPALFSHAVNLFERLAVNLCAEWEMIWERCYPKTAHIVRTGNLCEMCCGDKCAFKCGLGNSCCWFLLLLPTLPPTIVKVKRWPPLVWRQTTQTLHRGFPLSLCCYMHVCFSRFPSMLLYQETEQLRSTAEGRFLWCDLHKLCKHLSVPEKCHLF